MHSDGITATHSATIIIAFLLMHTASTVVTGALASVAAPLTITRFSPFPRVFVVVGFIVQIALLSFLSLMSTRERVVTALGGAIISVLGKLRIIKDPASLRERLAASAREHREKMASLRAMPGVLGKVFVYSVLNRIAPILASVFTYLALGNPAYFLKAFSLQTYVSIGAFCIPIPGSMGITDYLTLDGFGSIIPGESIIVYDLLSRAISFYSCIVICGITVLAAYIAKRKRRQR